MGGAKSAMAIGASPMSLWLYVEDCDALFNRAIAAGAKVRWDRVDDRHAQGRSDAAGDEAAHGRLHEAVRRGAAWLAFLNPSASASMFHKVLGGSHRRSVDGDELTVA